MRFTSHTIQEILPQLEKALKEKNRVSFEVLNPDIATNTYAGEKINIENIEYLYRGYKAWTDLAQILKSKLCTPKTVSKTLVLLTFEKLETKESFHQGTSCPIEEKYGATSYFSKINKMEEPSFYYYYEQALHNINITQRKRVLNLGINTGDEFKVINNLIKNPLEMIGIDHSKTAIKEAKKRLPQQHIQFYTQDITTLNALNLGKFDVLISIGTLQSSTINFKPFFMELIQQYLEKDSAIILGFPNSRWIGGEMVYGAKAPNYSMNEMSLVLNDIIFAKKYLQQHKYRVTITGKEYLFLTATKIV